MPTRAIWLIIAIRPCSFQATWQLREALYRGLKQWPWFIEPHLSLVMGIDKRHERKHDGLNEFQK